MANLKAVKGGKTDETPDVKHVTLRGIEYTIREIDVVEYDKMIESLADENGAVRFDKLLRQMVLKAVTPLGSAPLKFPVYRALETIVNEMHYTDLEEDKEAKPEAVADEGEVEAKADPNS